MKVLISVIRAMCIVATIVCVGCAQVATVATPTAQSAPLPSSPPPGAALCAFASDGAAVACGEAAAYCLASPNGKMVACGGKVS